MFGFSMEDVCRVGENCKTTKLNGFNSVAGVKLRGDKLLLKGTADVSVYDMHGRLVLRELAHGAGEIQLSTLVKNAGLYRIVVKQGSKKFVATYAKVK